MIMQTHITSYACDLRLCNFFDLRALFSGHFHSYIYIYIYIYSGIPVQKVARRSRLRWYLGYRFAGRSDDRKLGSQRQEIPGDCAARCVCMLQLGLAGTHANSDSSARNQTKLPRLDLQLPTFADEHMNTRSIGWSARSVLHINPPARTAH